MSFRNQPANPLLKTLPPDLPPPAVATVPENEADRLGALHQYDILDTLPEKAFDDLTALAAYICGSPISLLSLIDEHRQWFKSRVGLAATDTPRDIAFCSHAILQPNQLMIVPDTLQDDRFAANPLVKDDPNIRFYAGAPLVTPDGYPLGTLCVLDRAPRQLTPEQQQALQALSRQAVDQMELRLSIRKLERQKLRYQQAEAKLRASDQQVVDLLEGMKDGFFALDRHGCFSFVNRKAGEILQQLPEALLGKTLEEALDKMLYSTFAQQYRKAIEQQISISFEMFSQPLARWLETRAFPSYDGLSVFMHDITNRKTIEEALRYQQGQTELLLLNVLPQPIVSRLKQQDGIIADSFAEATVLFADLVGFTDLASQVSAAELVSLLNTIFSAFDQLTEKYGLEKIKTIGDAYLIVGGVPTPRADHVEAIANIALDMQQAIKQFSTPQGKPLSLCIGINTGAVVAGVIGTKKFSYDLWGDTVNVASRMQSHTPADSIQVTEATYQQLREQYLFEERGFISVKGKGMMKTYLLISQKLESALSVLS
ncbi:MAG TPA: adenylate/guanylate cyclase domain-containing protein [Coleofasciculaceae cyanobacterium]